MPQRNGRFARNTRSWSTWAIRPVIASAGTPGTFTDYLVRGAIEKAERERQRIREHLDYAAEEELRPLLERADRYLDDVRLIGDATLAAFFKGSKPAERR